MSLRVVLAAVLASGVVYFAWSGSRCPVPGREGFRADREDLEVRGQRARQRIVAASERSGDPASRRMLAKIERGAMTDSEFASAAARGAIPSEVFDALVEKVAPAREAATRESESPPGGAREDFCALESPLVMGPAQETR